MLGQVTAPWACDKWTDDGALIPAGNEEMKKFQDDEKEQRRQWCLRNKQRFDVQVKETKERRKMEHIQSRKEELKFLAEDKRMKAEQDAQEFARRQAEAEILREREDAMNVFVNNKRAVKQRQIDTERKQTEAMQDQLREQAQEEMMSRHHKSIQQQKMKAEFAERHQYAESERTKELEHERKLIQMNEERLDKQERDRKHNLDSIKNKQNSKQNALMEYTQFKSPRTVAREQEEEIQRTVAEAQLLKDAKDNLKAQKKKKQTVERFEVIDKQLAYKKENKILAMQNDRQFASKIQQNELRMVEEDKRMQEQRKAKQRQIRSELKEQMQEQRKNRNVLDHMSTRVLSYQQGMTSPTERGHRTRRQPGGKSNHLPFRGGKGGKGGGKGGRSPSATDLSTREAQLLKKISDQNDKRAERVLSNLSP